MIWDGDDNQNDIFSDDSLERNGKGSNDEKIVDDVRQLLGQTAPAQRDDSDSSVEIARVDFEHSDRNCDSGAQRGDGWGRGGGGGGGKGGEDCVLVA